MQSEEITWMKETIKLSSGLTLVVHNHTEEFFGSEWKKKTEKFCGSEWNIQNFNTLKPEININMIKLVCKWCE